jgi:putative solute:sodium symporter small subunit
LKPKIFSSIRTHSTTSFDALKPVLQGPRETKMARIDERSCSIKTYDRKSLTKDDKNFTNGDVRAQLYWKRLKKITVVWMLAWAFPAVLFHVPIALTSSIKVFNGIPLHWFNASLLSILVGVILIFLYAFVMDKTDKILRGR